MIFVITDRIWHRFSKNVGDWQAEALGVSRSTFQGIKKRIRESGGVNLNTIAMKKLI